MNNKVKFLRGTSNEYAVAEKDSDTIYFTTDDGKLYIGDKEVSGSDITIDDTLSDTSTNPVQNKVVKQAIDNKADKTVATTSADGLMSAEDKGKLDAFEITTTGGKLHDKDIATTDLIPTTLPANGGNADTVDGLHAWTHGMLNSSGGFDPSLWFTCQHNVFGDDRYGLISSDGKQIRCHYASEAYNAALLGGVTDAYHLGTLNAGGDGHGGGFQLSCQHNVFGDNRFVLQIANRTHEVRVDYATNADTLDGLHASDIITSSKPYVTGTGVPVYSEGSYIVTTNHGFMPSAVMWWVDVISSSGDVGIQSANSFNNTQFEIASSSSIRPVYYIIFK